VIHGDDVAKNGVLEYDECGESVSVDCGDALKGGRATGGVRALEHDAYENRGRWRRGSGVYDRASREQSTRRTKRTKRKKKKQKEQKQGKEK
jgi:hypothetical protein